jgi:hypothetical protein
MPDLNMQNAVRVLEGIEKQLKRIGFGDATKGDGHGAIEGLTMHLDDRLKDAVDRICDRLQDIADPLSEIAQHLSKQQKE